MPQFRTFSQVLLSALLASLLGACATGAGNDGKINIVSASNGNEFAGANCVVNTNSQTWNIVTPATLTIGNANGDLHIVCRKAGYRTSELILPPYGQSGSSVGLGMGGGSGNVGVGLGFSLPISTGGGYYPARVMITMHPQ
jgi:hypothetical protein